MTTAPACDVLTVGEPLVVFAATEPGPLWGVRRFERFSAGAELNVAIGLARLDFDVAYLSRVGADSFGTFLLDTLEREGITRCGVGLDPDRATGFMLKSRTLDGRDPAIEYHRRDSAASRMSVDNMPARLDARTRHLHVTGISPALSESCCDFVFRLAGAARAAGCRVSFDPNVRERLWASPQVMRDTLARLAGLADLVLPGLEEGRLLTGGQSPQDIAAFYFARGAQDVVVKLGPDGAYCATSGQPGVFVPGHVVDRVVDTVGAGDAFAVGVISARLDGLALPEAARRGNALGARTVGFPGDCDGLPTRAELVAGM